MLFGLCGARSARGLLRTIRLYQRPVLLVLACFFILDTLFLLQGQQQAPPPATSAQAQHGDLGNTTVFIASVHRNTQDMLLSSWNDAVVKLVSVLGPEHVHFSAIESGSQDGTKIALTELKDRLDALGVSHTIHLGMSMWEQIEEIEKRPSPTAERRAGWIWNVEDSRYEMRRIPYLSKVRNQAMQPVKTLVAEGRRFDKILWLNDVVFDTEDVLRLMGTRGGHYAAACSMDFKTYPLFYDTFALRDNRGEKPATQSFPWFMSAKARASARHGGPVRVFSCWNGIVSFDSTPFYADLPLQFRGIPDSLADQHLEASECCLIHADNPLSAQPDKGVWLNPSVRVGYSVPVYSQIKGGLFPDPTSTLVGAWADRAWRIRFRVQLWLEGFTVHSRLRRWRWQAPAGEPARKEPGEPCLINEMQVMWQNGWKHL